MDDPQKPGATQANIDELVKELSRPSTPSAPATPAPSAPKPPVSNTPAMPPKPAMPAPAAPAPKPITPPASSSAPAKPIPPSPVPVPGAPKEYQTNIRTMADDLSKLKAGQQPSGVTVPRTVEPPKPTAPAVPKPAVPAMPAPAKPTPPSQTNLGQAQKAAPMAPLPKPVAPSAPAPRPSVPTLTPPTKAPEAKSQFYTPALSSNGVGGNRNLIFIGIGVAAVLLGVVYWYFMIRQPEEVAIATPVPTATLTPIPTPQDVFQVAFPGQVGTIVLPAKGDPTTAFANALNAEGPNPGEFLPVDISNTGASGSSTVLDTLGIFDRFSIKYPAEFKNIMIGRTRALDYGQQESFDAKGKVVQAGLSKRLVLVTEVASSSATVIQSWEPAMTAALANLLSYNKAKNTKPFQDNSYQGVPVRYKNFPYPDHSIDYGVITRNGKYYWILASSRESMFAAVNALSR